jgi:hypothetical protein
MSNGSTLFKKQNAKVPHLVQAGGGGVAGEVGDLRNDLDTELAAIAPITVDDYVNPPTADVDAIKTAFASQVAPVTYTGAQLTGVVGAAAMAIPRNITVTTGAGGTPADVPANLTVTGTYQGRAQTETIAISQTAATVAGTKPFDVVTSLALDAGQGTGGTLEVGFGAGLGLTKTPKARASSATVPFREITNAAVPGTGGTISTDKLYVPNTAPNGTNDYAVYYEYDPAA